MKKEKPVTREETFKWVNSILSRIGYKSMEGEALDGLIISLERYAFLARERQRLIGYRKDHSGDGPWVIED